MNAVLAMVFKAALTVAALFTAPVTSYMAGHPLVYQIVEFVGGLVALLLKSPLEKLAAKKLPPGPQP